MNKYETTLDFEIKKIDFQFHPLYTMMTYIQIGLLFWSFNIHIAWLPYITTTIGTLLMVLGLRIVKDDSHFEMAYKFSIINSLIQMISLMIVSSRYISYLSYWQGFSICSIYAYIYCLYRGLSYYVENKRYAKLFLFTYVGLQIISYTGMYYEFLFWVFVVMYIGVFIWLFHILSQIKEDILEHQYHIQLSMVKIETYKIVIGYFLAVVICVSSTFAYSILTGYQYSNTEAIYNDNYHQTIEDVIEIDNLKLKYKYHIVETQEDDLHILEYEWIDLPRFTYLTQIDYYSLSYNTIKGIYFNTDHNSYVYNMKTNQTSHYYRDFYLEEYTAYVNPLSNELKGIIYFSFDKEHKVDLQEHSITFGIRNTFDIPYVERYDKSIELIIQLDNRKIRNIYSQKGYMYLE